jgi:hypothetical protein
MTRELNVLALVKGSDRYVYLFDDADREQLLDAVRDHAAHPRLSLTWFDAAVLTQRVRAGHQPQKQPVDDR